MITCELIKLQSAPPECFEPSAMPSIKTKEKCVFSGKNCSDHSEKVSVGKKRKSTEMVEQPNSFDVVMNLSRKRQCSAVLKKLKSHNFGWLFSVPVDPVKLKIPDYFSIITKPMDLGTVEKKLEKQLYLNTSKFAADVRLTFSNAMRYNPPDNPVHGYAKMLNCLFDSSWKELELKWRKGSVTSTLQPASVVKSLLQSSTKGAINGNGEVRHKTGRVNGKTGKSNHPHVGAERHCCQQDDSTQDSTSDLDSERSHGRENLLRDSNTSNLDCKKAIAYHQEYSSSDSGRVFDGDNVVPTHHSSLAISREINYKDDLPCEETLSPTRARRAAILKERFKDTILKAYQNTLLNGEKGDPISMQREKEKLEKKHQEEMARIEQAKAAEAAAQREAEIALKMQLQKEREEARIALEQMEKTVDTHDNNGWVLEELKHLGCLRPAYTLEKLGLFMKADTIEEESCY